MIHPIIAQMTPSPEQEPAIVRRGCDVVVTAGAGTGKTRTLVARYLSLLAEGLSVRHMVAITFTTKAAREMRNRVREEMRCYLQRQDLGPAERERWQEHYRQLDAARIGTIHSLSSEILRAHPAEAGVDPRFQVLEEGQHTVLLDRSLDDALAWAAEDPEAAQLFALLEERQLRGYLRTLQAQRLDAAEAFANQPVDLLDRWQQVLSRRQQAALDTLVARTDWQEARAIVQEAVPTDGADRMAIQRQLALHAIQTAVGTLDEHLAALSALDGINLSGGRIAGWPHGREQVALVKGSLKTIRELWRANSDVLGLALGPLDQQLAQALPLLRAVFTYACERYELVKRERNSLDFDDMEARSLRLLRENETARDRWQHQVRAIVVDEFQDTNRRQQDLITLLNGDGERLFIVGDAKQSIYRFRGADVVVFRAERERIGAEGAAFELQTSYRAHRDLVRALNDLLMPILGQEADPGRPWAEPFAPLGYRRCDPGPGFAPPHVELHLTVGTKGTGALKLAAAALAARLVGLVEGGKHRVLDQGVPRPLGYGDVAILCRASTSFGAYEDALESSGVPFLTVAGRGFYSRPEVRDLLNGLQALADPTDDLALVGLLRSPAFGLSDVDLFHLAEEREAAAGAPLWHVLRDGAADRPGDRGNRAARAARVIGDLHQQAGRTPVAALLKALLDRTDYRAALLHAGQARGARNVAKLLADAHASTIVSVSEFLEYIDGLRDSGTREGEARATVEGAVQIMSVHQAKGLEFPVVVLGDVTKRGRSGYGPLVDPCLGVVLPLKDDNDDECAVYRLARDRASDQEQAESSRLLYVAATRAREKLILSGFIGSKRDGSPGSPAGWLGDLCRDAEDERDEGLDLAPEQIDHAEEGNRAVRLDLHAGLTPVACTVYEPQWQDRRIARAAEPAAQAQDARPVPLPPPLLAPVIAEGEIIDQRTAAQERTPPQRVWRVVPAVARPRAPRWVVGKLVHEALAAWRFPTAVSPDQDEVFGRWARARGRELGIADHHQLADAAAQTALLLLRFREHPLHAEMDGSERRLHEVPYSLMSDGRVDAGIVDALFFREGRWTIVEFKTDEVRDRSALVALLEGEDYLPQADRYVAAAERLLGQRPQTLLCLLDFASSVLVFDPAGGVPGEAAGDA